MGARSKARKRALDLLFESEARGVDPLATLAERLAGVGAAPINAYAVALVEGVVAHQDAIDALLSEHARGWPLDRMPAVDRAVLRIGTYELLARDDVPDAVAVSEAVALAAQLSTEDSPAFVNGLLGRLLELRPTLQPAGSSVCPTPP